MSISVQEAFGIQETKDVLDFITTLAESLSVSLSDGEFDPADVVNFIPVLQKVIPAFDDLSLVPFELRDLTDEEKEELVAHLQDNLELEDEVLEAFVEAGFAAALELFKFINMFFPPNA